MSNTLSIEHLTIGLPEGADEAYLFVAAIYLFFGYALSLYARQVEKWINTGRI